MSGVEGMQDGMRGRKGGGEVKESVMRGEGEQGEK